MAFKVAVLSIDGGGIKGIVPAMILAEIEKRTGKKICEMFDLIAGTSTGGILALGLTKPKKDKREPEFTAKHLVKLYENKGKEIFQRGNQDVVAHLFQSVEIALKPFGISNINIKDLFTAKYSRVGKQNIINEYFGDTYIKEALTEVLITSYATNLRLPFFFTSQSLKEQEYKKAENFCVVCQGYKMKQAAMATSAAPTYFKPYPVPAIHRPESTYTLIDGGVFANNPTSIAIIEAMNSYTMKTKDSISLKDVLVVSLGTGRKPHKLNLEDMEKWGQLKWIEPLINMVFAGQSEVVDYQMEQLLSNQLQREAGVEQHNRYYRFQPQYSEIDISSNRSIDLPDVVFVNDAMDDASKDNISALVKVTEQLIISEDVKLNSLCEQLKTFKKLDKDY
jgi:patatin-like phospholipase/acyl hydrolase